MSNEKYTDTHTLYIKCETATEGQIRQCFYQAISEYKTSEKLDTRFNVNVVTNKNGESFGIAFVFLVDPAFYHMFLGKNPDGSDRIQYIDDPSWSKPNEGELINNTGWSFVAPTITENMSWADICDLEDAYEESKKEKEQKKVATQLDPLITLPPYTLTDEQLSKKQAKIFAANANIEKEKFFIPTIAHLQIDRAIVSPVPPKFMHNILKAKEVPSWVTREDLKIRFTPYATDSKTLYGRTVKGITFTETYPFVNINNDGVCFIIFDPSTHDAQFALLMAKKVRLEKQIKGTNLVTTLLFTHSFCTDRDIITTSSNKPKIIKSAKFNKKHSGSKQYHKPTAPTTFSTKNSYASLDY